MLFKQFIWSLVFMAISSLAIGQSAPQNWFNLDKRANRVLGVSTEKAYRKVLNKKKGVPVIVGVLDSGVDEDHEDLKNVMWVNLKEIPGNGIDDDNNGYIDDIYGWNFIGGKDGKNVEVDSYELTRVYNKLKEEYENIPEASMTDGQKKGYLEFLQIKVIFLEKSSQAKRMFELYSKFKTRFDKIEASIGKNENITIEDLKNYKPSNNQEAATIAQVIKTMETGVKFSEIKAELKSAYDHFDKEANFAYNLDFNPRTIVGDNYNDENERYYGNNDVTGPDASHGTHVAGIIAAQRDNNLGVKGVADHVKIMSVRCVPDGDERDKDVANAIRYAVDNGAKVINMSFGKAYPWNKALVDEAVKYAESKDVLLVHGAGNDAKNIDSSINYPNPNLAFEGRRALNWVEVGASSWTKRKNKLGNFSNYGKKNVDVFAPGVSIYSTIPGSKYASFDGTSMASPCTAGVAALLRSYFPDLTSAQVRKILIKTTKKVRGKVYLPGGSYVAKRTVLSVLGFKKFIKNRKQTTKLKKISVSGGVINAYKAVKMADKMSKF